MTQTPSAAPAEPTDEQIDAITAQTLGLELRRDFARVFARAILAAFASPDAPKGEPTDWAAVEKFTDEYIDEYEMVGESEDGRDACYTPDADDKALMRDMLAGLFAEPDFIRLLALRSPQSDNAAKVAPELGDTFEPTMSINALPGTPIRFRAGGGYDFERKAALEAGFVKNAVYTVKRCDIGSSMTKVLVDELPGRWNSCLFADVAQQAREPIEDAKDAARVPMRDEQLMKIAMARCIKFNAVKRIAREIEAFHGIGQSAKEKGNG